MVLSFKREFAAHRIRRPSFNLALVFLIPMLLTRPLAFLSKFYSMTSTWNGAGGLCWSPPLSFVAQPWVLILYQPLPPQRSSIHSPKVRWSQSHRKCIPFPSVALQPMSGTSYRGIVIQSWQGHRRWFEAEEFVTPRPGHLSCWPQKASRKNENYRFHG